MKNSFSKVAKVLSQLIRRFINWIGNNRHILLYIAGILILECIVVSKVNIYAKLVAVLVVCFIFYVCLLVFLEGIKEQLHIPLWPKELIHKSSDGYLYINREDQEQAIEYLHAIEVYIKKNDLR